MGGMAGGCDICHHHTAPGHMHPACSECHKAALAARPVDEMRMPSLKGAYHRQCMGCHRDWSHHTKCVVCHLLKSPDQPPITELAQMEMPSPGDVAGHPEIESPKEISQQTKYEEGPHVVFRHMDHIERYGYECARCHKGQSCSQCHELAAAPGEPEVVRSAEERHAMCYPCHEDDKCERCHSKEANPPPQYFDHSVTGFALGKYHERLTCKACHKRLFFIRKLQPECTFCHDGWTPENFNHAVTGQVLDENHAETDCSECHADNNYTEPPSCDECHDVDDDGISFPEKRPGPLTAATTQP